MLNYDEAMRLLKSFGVCVVGNGTLFIDERMARATAKAYGAEPIEIRALEPSAWFVKKAKDYDPQLTAAIEKAIAESGLAD